MQSKLWKLIDDNKNDDLVKKTMWKELTDVFETFTDFNKNSIWNILIVIENPSSYTE